LNEGLVQVFSWSANDFSKYENFVLWRELIGADVRTCRQTSFIIFWKNRTETFINVYSYLYIVIQQIKNQHIHPRSHYIHWQEIPNIYTIHTYITTQQD